MRWPWKRPQQRSLISVSDPALATLFGVGGAQNFSGVEVGEGSALGLSSVWRAVSLISQTLAALPMPTLAEPVPGIKERVSSFLDNPGGPGGPTPFEWTETVYAHLLLHGNAYLIHVRGGAGQLVGLVPVHPMCVSPEQASRWPDGSPVVGGKIFRVSLADGTVPEFDGSSLLHIPALCTDGFLGLSPIAMARQSIGTGIAADRAAAKLFGEGALISGIVTADGDDVEPEDVEEIRKSIERRTAGWENASQIRFVNRRLKFTPWSLSPEDAQFLQSRAFQVEEIARWFGVPPHLLMQTDKQTSWGTGVAESNRGMGRTVLAPWATRVEQRLSTLLRGDRKVAFDFSGLERPSPETETSLLAQKIDAGIITVNEARSTVNLPPVPGGDVLRIKGVPLADTTGGTAV
jgi:HK97 family phage portal protein